MPGCLWFGNSMERINISGSGMPLPSEHSDLTKHIFTKMYFLAGMKQL